MNREQLEELAALHALGLLEGEELRAFEQELASNPAARQLVAELNHAAASLALTADSVAPPPSLRARTLAALPDRASAAPASATAPLTPVAPAKVVSFQWIPWALAACFAVAAGLLFVRYDAARAQVATLEAEKREVGGQLAALMQSKTTLEGQLAAKERERIVDRLQIAALRAQPATNPDAAAIIAWDPQTQQGLLKVANLPPAPEGKDYQLWVVDPRYPTPVDGGVFNTAASGEAIVPFQPRQGIEAIELYAVSLEVDGGVPVAEGAMVLVGQ